MWPTAIAVVAGFAHFLGYLETRQVALSLDALTTPAISQEYIFVGAGALLAMVGPAIAIATAFILLSKAVSWLTGQVSSPTLERLRSLSHHPALWWVGLLTVIAGAALLSDITLELARRSDGMILKQQAEIGGTWMNMVLDQESDSFTTYWAALCGGLAVFVAISRWLMISGFKARRTRLLFGCWALLQALVLMSLYSMIFGASSTIRKYPVAAFSSQEQLLGKGTVSVLVGSDDKQFAFLVVFPYASPKDTKKTILYVPRTEIKWLSIIGEAPLHVYAHYDELKKPSSIPPTIPAPPSDAK